MSLPTIEQGALPDFQDGFSDGWHGRPRQPGRSIIYRNAYARGREARQREDQ